MVQLRHRPPKIKIMYICKICKTHVSVKYGSGQFCSRKCANTREHSIETKLKISNSLKSLTGSIKKVRKKRIKIKKNFYCKFCGKEFERCSRLYCSDICREKCNHAQNFLSKYFTFNLYSLGTEEAISEYDRVKDLLNDLYWKQNLTSSEICEKFNYHSSSCLMSKIFKCLKIPTRSVSESAFLSNKKGRRANRARNQYQSGYHITWNGDKVFLRSSYEFQYAKHLDAAKINYIVENIRIDYFDSQLLRHRTSIPDFYLVDSNTIVEVKSSYTLDPVNMLDRIKSYIDLGYDFKLYLNMLEYSLHNSIKLLNKIAQNKSTST